MNDIIIYLLKVSMAISLVTIPYYLWLRQDAALNIKRTYLTGGLSGGIVYTDQANGVFKITIPQAETFAVPEGRYVYDIIATILSTRVNKSIKNPPVLVLFHLSSTFSLL